MTIQKRISRVQTLPMIALRGLVVYPDMELHFDVGRKRSMQALHAAMNHDQTLFLVTQRDTAVEEPTEDELYTVGVVAQVRQNLPEAETLLSLAELFKTFGDGTRVRILYVLLEAEVCVCDLATLLGMTQSAVSHQLRILKQARLIKSRRDGKTVFYSLADDHVATLLKQGMEHVCED